MKKILYVIHRCWPYMGGAERLFWEWAKSSRDAGYEVTVFTTNAWDIEYFHDKSKTKIDILEEVVDGIRIRRFQIFILPISLQRNLLKKLSSIPLKFFQYVFGYPYILLPGYLWNMLFSKEKYDLLNAGIFPHLFLTYPALQFAKRMKIPCVCTPLIHLGEPHPPYDGADYFLSMKNIELLRSFNMIVTMTQLEKEALIKKGLDGKMINVIGAGVSPKEVLQGNGVRFREKYNIREKIVISIATQTHDKGSHHLVEAMKILWQDGIEATLVLIGQVMNDFDAFWTNQPPWVFERVIVLDYIDEKTKWDALDASSVFVMSSKAESFGIVFLEAWLYKKPVIGAYAGALPEIIQDGKDGFLVPFADIHMLSEYIRLLIHNPPLADAMGHNGRLKVLKQYTWDKSCEKIQSVYKELLSQWKNSK